MTPEQIRDAALAWLKEHRAHCHDDVCFEPMNFLAFFGHSLGLRTINLGAFARNLAEYERHCTHEQN